MQLGLQKSQGEFRLNNKEIILSGLTTGIIGYAIGNYLGVGFAYIFRAVLF